MQLTMIYVWNIHFSSAICLLPISGKIEFCCISAGGDSVLLESNHLQTTRQTIIDVIE